MAFSGNLVTHPTSPHRAWGLGTVPTLREGRDWHKDRNIDQWNKIESTEINPCRHKYRLPNTGPVGCLLFHEAGFLNLQTANSA